MVCCVTGDGDGTAGINGVVVMRAVFPAGLLPCAAHFSLVMPLACKDGRRVVWLMGGIKRLFYYELCCVTASVYVELVCMSGLVFMTVLCFIASWLVGAPTRWCCVL